MSDLLAVHAVFTNFGRASDLSFKAAKCKLIPLRRHDGSEKDICARYARVLSALTPEWADFQVVGEGTYLGSRIGPATTETSQWEEPIAKFNDRVKVMARAGVAPLAALHYYDLFVQLPGRACGCACVRGRLAALAPHATHGDAREVRAPTRNSWASADGRPYSPARHSHAESGRAPRSPRWRMRHDAPRGPPGDWRYRAPCCRCEAPR